MNRPRIRYAANVRMPTSKAHGLQIMRTCEALAKAGADVELVVPKRRRMIAEDPFTFYAVKPLFKITYLPTIEFSWGGYTYAFWLQTLAFTLSLSRYIAQKESDGAYLYVRGELGWLLPLVSKATYVWENHIPPRKHSAEARAVRRARGIVVVTNKYRDRLIREFHVLENKVLVAPDGVDLAQFAPIGKQEARAKLGLPEDKKLALYVGSDLPWKWLGLFKEAAEYLPEGYEAVFVGPIKPQGAGRFVGVRPNAEVPLWLSAADALVLTGDPASETAREYTSPLKLFEYMAAERPIVAVDLPSFRDVLSERTAVLVPPGDPKAFADAIVETINAPESGVRAEAAYRNVADYTWEVRGKRVLDFICELYSLS